MKFTFVILHYITVNDTIECVNSIINNIEYDNFDILIVDNGSPTKNFHVVVNEFDGYSNIHFLKLEQNLGFSKGNNKGIEFARSNLNSDFIILINNDMEVKQGSFLTEILSKYREKHFDVMGPNIISLTDDGHQNPVALNGINVKNVNKSLNITRLLNFLNRFYLDNLFLIVYRLIKYKFFKTPKKNFSEENFSKDMNNVLLHGSCLILSPTYLQKYNGLFSKTFLYVEEDILFSIAQKEKMKLIYSPCAKIYHKEDSATNELLGVGRNKRQFKYQHTITSLKELMKIEKDPNYYKGDIYLRNK